MQQLIALHAIPQFLLLRGICLSLVKTIVCDLQPNHKAASPPPPQANIVPERNMYEPPPRNEQPQFMQQAQVSHSPFFILLETHGF